MRTGVDASRASVQASRAGRTGVRTCVLASKSSIVGTASTVDAGVDSIPDVAIMRAIIGGSTVAGVVDRTGAQRVRSVASGVVRWTITVHTGIRGVGDIAVMRSMVCRLVGFMIVLVGVVGFVVGDSLLDLVNDVRHDEMTEEVV